MRARRPLSFVLNPLRAAIAIIVASPPRTEVLGFYILKNLKVHFGIQRQETNIIKARMRNIRETNTFQ